MVEQDFPEDGLTTDFNIDGILKKMFKMFNNPSLPVCFIYSMFYSLHERGVLLLKHPTQ